MKITKITLYNVPFRYSTQDRIIENVDTKIERWKKDTIVATIDTDGNALFDTVAYDITNGFEGSITINSANRYNYARLETDLYGTKPVYVFLHALKSIESSTGFSYNIKIDVMASFGKELFDKMNGKNVLIDRMHEDRYIDDVANAKWYVNTNLHGLANTDFQVGDTVAQEILKSSIDMRDTHNGVTKCAISVAAPQLTSYVAIVNKYMDRYFYAIITSKGAPKITNAQAWSLGSFFKNDILICPLNTNSYSTPLTPSQNQVTNTMQMFENLQDGKVISIFSTPFMLYADQEDIQSIAFKGKIGNETYVWTPIEKTSDFENPKIDEKGNVDVNYLVGFAFKPWSFTVKSLIQNYGFTSKYLINLPYANKTLYKQWLANGKFEEYSRFELGMLNNGVSPISLYHNGDFNHVDFLDVVRNDMLTNSKDINFNYVLAEDGVKGTFALTPNQYVDIESFNTISFYTDAGKSYLAQNGAYMNAQKRGYELQGELQKTQVRSQRFQNGAAAANPISAVMSLGTSLIGNAAAAAYNTVELGQIDKITDNEKAKIDAHIQDLGQTSPISHAGSGKGWGWSTLPIAFGSTFMYTMKYPNINLARKIYFYLQKHGYKIDDWMSFSSDIYNSRTEWNMLTIKQALDYIPQTDYDDSIITEFAARLENGVRIWHKDDFTIDYTKINLEKKLKTWLDS